MKLKRLKGIMAEKGYSGTKLAEETGIKVETMRRKLRSGKFGIDEAAKISEVLGINEPEHIFFAPEDT